MSARPAWLTDEMLAEMRRLKGTSKDDPKLVADTFHGIDEADTEAHDETERWWCYSEYDRCWLTEAGNEALAAIEAEEADRFTIHERPLVWKYTGTQTKLIAIDSDGRDRSDEFRIEPGTGLVQFRGSEPFSGTVEMETQGSSPLPGDLQHEVRNRDVVAVPVARDHDLERVTRRQADK